MATNLQKHAITAFYEKRDDADRAADKLRRSGVPAADVTISPENARDEYGAYGGDRSAAAVPGKTGFWASLEDMFGGTDDHHTYAEGVRRGHVLLTANVSDAQLDPAIAIIEEHGSIDLDEHEQTWRSEGWTGGATTAATGAAAVAGGAMGLASAGGTAPTRVVETETLAERAPPVVPAAPKPALAAGAVGRGDEDVVQVIEERLDVGKRAVSRGKVRLHSRIVEREATADVSLRGEKVSIERRAVDRPVATLGVDAFKERTIELEETDEEAVVAKTARVVEEIGIRKQVSDRVETIRDTVRATEVDIDDGRTTGVAAAGSAATGRFASQLVKDMEVVGSDGVHVGVIDRLDGAMMKLKRMDAAAGGRHHLLAADLVASVDGKAVLRIAAADAMQRWQAA